MTRMNTDQFSLRRLFLVIAVIAAVAAAVGAFWRSYTHFQKEAVRNAIRSGQIDGAFFRGWFTAEEFEQLRAEARKHQLKGEMRHGLQGATASQ
jgi:hypothetical protein